MPIFLCPGGFPSRPGSPGPSGGYPSGPAGLYHFYEYIL